MHAKQGQKTFFISPIKHTDEGCSILLLWNESTTVFDKFVKNRDCEIDDGTLRQRKKRRTFSNKSIGLNISH